MQFIVNLLLILSLISATISLMAFQYIANLDIRKMGKSDEILGRVHTLQNICMKILIISCVAVFIIGFIAVGIYLN